MALRGSACGFDHRDTRHAARMRWKPHRARDHNGTDPTEDALMNYQDTSAQLARYRQEIVALRKKMRELQKSVEPQEVEDYELASTAGPVRLSELFGDKDYLFVIHNMGASCPYCTLW